MKRTLFIGSLIAGVATGCTQPSPFAPVASSADIGGTFYNSDVGFRANPATTEPVGYSLWTAIQPKERRTAQSPIDRPSDCVRLSIDERGLVTATLVRGDVSVDECRTEFSFDRRQACLRRHDVGVFVQVPILLWLLYQREQKVGLNGQADRPRALRVERYVDGTMWVIAFPIGGAGGGPPDVLFYERVEPATQPMTAQAQP